MRDKGTEHLKISEEIKIEGDKICQTCDDYDGKKEKNNAVMLDRIPKFICISMVIIVLIQVVGTILVYLINEKVDGVAVSINAIENYLTGNLLTVGLAVIALAVSVWVGLNIYISLSQTEVFHLQKNLGGLEKSIDNTIRDLNAKMDEQHKEFIRLEMQHFINQLETLHYQYALSGYFAFLFRQMDIHQGVEFIHSLIECEDEYIFWTAQYEAERYEDCYNGCKKLEERFLTIREHYQKDIKKGKEDFGDKVIMAYLDNRIAEMIYYPNACSLRIGREEQFDMGEMEKVIDTYKGLVESMKVYFPAYDEQSIVLAYIYNTIGYSMDLMNQVDKKKNGENKQAIEKRMKDAAFFTAQAVEYLKDKKHNKSARYLRNKGLTLERKGELDKAGQIYEESIKADVTDEKSWNNRATIIIKKLEKDCNIFKRNEILDQMDSGRFEKWISELEKAKAMYELALIIEPSFVDPYYKLIQVHTYLYLANSNRAEKSEEAEKYIELLKIWGYMGAGYLFACRNYYEAIGNMDNALEVNKRISPNKNNDVEHMEHLYRIRYNKDIKNSENEEGKEDGQNEE